MQQSPCNQKEIINLSDWNATGLWRKWYGDLADDCLFFAQDIFGFQFAIKNGLIWSFDAETGFMTELAPDLEAWAGGILADYEYLTGYPFGHAWQTQYRPLLPNERLFPKKMFVLGGSYELSNLVASDAAKGMQFRGCIAQQIKDLPDGTRIEIEFDPVH